MSIVKRDYDKLVEEEVNAVALALGKESLVTQYAYLAYGIDIRYGFSRLYEIISNIPAGREPTPEEWNEIRLTVMEDPAYRPASVDLQTQVKAMEKLLEYMHPKKKHVESTANVNATIRNLAPLTEDEIKLFEEKFHKDY